MQTLIFDIDGTLTNMAPIEQIVCAAVPPRRNMTINAWRDLYGKAFRALMKAGQLPSPAPYQTVGFIKNNAGRYRFVYATGALAIEAKYVLEALGILPLFDTVNSIDLDTCRFAKKTGIPFRRLKRLFPDCVLIADSQTDEIGAQKAGIPAIILPPNAELTYTQVAAANRQ